MSFQPLPTSVHHTTTRLTHREAHTILLTFLTQTETNAAYRPDSTLTERGPISSSTNGPGVVGGSDGNLTLHHLKRILKGIEGKRVGGLPPQFTDADPSAADNPERSRGRKRGADPDFSSRSGGHVQQNQTAQSSKRQAYPTTTTTVPQIQIEDPNPDNTGPGITTTTAAGVSGKGGVDYGGWQDKDDFELAQDVDGEMDVMGEDRHPGGKELEQPHNRREEEGLVEIEIEGTGGEMVDPRSEMNKVNSSSSSAARVGGGRGAVSGKGRETSQKVVDPAERKRLKRLRLKEDKAKRAEERTRKGDD